MPQNNVWRHEIKWRLTQISVSYDDKPVQACLFVRCIRICGIDMTLVWWILNSTLCHDFQVHALLHVIDEIILKGRDI